MTVPRPFPRALAGPSGRGAAAAECPAALADALARDLPALWDAGRGDVLKASRRTEVRLVAHAPGGAPVVLKRYRETAWRRRLGLGRARRAAGRAAAVAAAGLPVAVPLAWCEGPAGGFVASRYLAGAVGLDAALPSAAPGARHGLARAVGTLLGSLHARGFVHRDLKAANVLVSAAGPALVDLDGCRRAARASRTRRVRDLRRLARALRPVGLRATDCLRALTAYAAAVGASDAESRRLCRAALVPVRTAR